MEACTNSFVSSEVERRTTGVSAGFGPEPGPARTNRGEARDRWTPGVCVGGGDECAVATSLDFARDERAWGRGIVIAAGLRSWERSNAVPTPLSPSITLHEASNRNRLGLGGVAAGVGAWASSGASTGACGTSGAAPSTPPPHRTSIAARRQAQLARAPVRKRIGGVIGRRPDRGRCGRSCPRQPARCGATGGSGTRPRPRRASPRHWRLRRGGSNAAPAASHKRGR